MSLISGWLRKNRAQIDEDIQTLEARQYISPAFYAQYASLPALFRRYLAGRVIDLGCGTMPFRPELGRAVTLYHAIDIAPRAANIHLVGDIQNLGMIKAESYEGALCLEVLEHLPEPARALSEIWQVLAPGGILILSVPHLSRLHEIPHDYYRFTHYGLTALLTQAGFEIVELHQKGGLFSFLGHQLSTLLLGLAWSLPGLRQLAWHINRWVITIGCHLLDARLDHAGTFALGYIAVARKPPSEGDYP